MFKTKNILIVFVSALFLMGGSVEATKGETYGKIHIILTDGKEGTKKEGVEFSYIKVADWKDGSYEMRGRFATSNIDLDQIETAEQLEEVATELGELCEKMDGSIQTDRNGEAEIQDLSEGVYLITAKETKDYDCISPFLVAMPTWNEQCGEMIYEIEVIPKHTSIREKPKKEAIKTGDEMSKIWYGMGMSMGAVGAILCMWRMKEKKK
mgnify:FL=1